MRTSYRFITLLLLLLLLVAACANDPDDAGSDDEVANDRSLLFETTPEPGGQPQFLDAPTSPAEGSYPAPGSGESSYPAPGSGDDGYPAPVPPSDDSGYPAPNLHSVAGRDLTALEAYELVIDIALEEFHPEAYLTTVAPSQIMLNNLGNPPVLPGWFFKFRKPDSRREFIVQVVDDVPTGSTLTESAANVPQADLPLDVDALQLDSDDVFALFENVAVEQGIWEEGVRYDLELINLDGTSGPIWSVVHPITRAWLFSVDAISGEEVASPYEQ